ncbi:MAG: lysylphosphatidylglycerol synthase transmembrane domain-containing protein [bacterium]|nr:lysylphosphatidylglycerol synthase transmembrane domain-containing protein [bacterium]MDY4100678.1 lysylphosphatidylglycerol synthase transmembrane domain-containing protein [Lachnospiraceae bacterium]
MDKGKKKKLVINVLIFLAIMIGTVWFVFRDEGVDAVLTAMKQMSFGHLLLSVVIALFFVGAEGVMIWYLLRAIDGTSSLGSCISCSFIGFLFSGITPSATGGQPMQLYYLKRDGNSWSLSSVVLMTVALMYKLVLVIFGVGILIFWHEPLRGYLGKGYYRLFLLGLTLNAALVVGLLMVMFTPAVIRMLIAKVEWLAVKLHLMKKAGSKKARLDHFMENYQHALSFLKEHKGKMFVVFLGTVVQRAAVFALTYVVYRGMGMSGASLTTVMWLQAAVYIGVDMLPIPGAQGITEAMYRRAFLDIFTAGHVTASMCISRGVSFYLMILVGLVVTLYQFVIKK